MIPHKPKNHVQEAVEALRQDAAKAPSWPDIPGDLVLYLEENFPGRCYDHRAEDLEDHIRYAGQVDLVQTLRLVFERQKAEAEEDSTELSPWDAVVSSVPDFGD